MVAIEIQMGTEEKYIAVIKDLPIGLLFDSLRNQGFGFGVDTWETAYTVIFKAIESGNVSKLDMWLCPVLAHSAEQQSVFLEIYKRLFIPAIEKQIEDTEKEQKPEIPENPDLISQENTALSTQKQVNEEQQKIVASLKSRSSNANYINRFVKDTEVVSDKMMVKVVRQLRYTELSGRYSFDTVKTIHKTIHGGGLALPVYTGQRRHIEYLMLIDRHNSRDHQAQLHNSFYETLKTNNIFVERFYFDNSPLICRNHRHEGGIALSEILNLYEHAVLMVFTDGLQFIDTLDVKIFKWAMVFKHWQHRFFFSSVSPSYWGTRERLLQEVFRFVLPLSVEGIQTMAGELSQTVNTLGDPLDYWQKNADYSLVPVQTVDKPLETIGLFFNSHMKRWIAACAVYPELNWNLTLALGEKFSYENTVLNSHRNISQLLRLEWFKFGRIPDVFRTAMIEKWLSPEDIATVHGFLYEQLSQNMPLPGEPDYEGRLLQLAVYDLLRQKDSDIFKQKANELKEIIEKTNRLPDMVTLHLINEHYMNSIYFEIPDSVLLRMGIDPSQTKQAKKIPANFVLIRGDIFNMGSPEKEVDRIKERETQHSVKLSDFYLCKYAVTVADFKIFVDENKYLTDAEKGDGSYLWNGKEWKKEKGINWRFGVSGKVREQSEFDHPVVHVSWNDAMEYCRWLSAKPGRNYRLPTEAEWEYACRAGTKTPFNTGDNLTTDQANYDGNFPYKNNKKGKYRETTVPVNHFEPNGFGLYNMHGNVWEWCNDWYGDNYYDKCLAIGTVENPAGPKTGSFRVFRGGSWDNSAQYCRSAYRNYRTPDLRSHYLGFRLALVP